MSYVASFKSQTTDWIWFRLQWKEILSGNKESIQYHKIEWETLMEIPSGIRFMKEMELFERDYLSWAQSPRLRRRHWNFHRIRHFYPAPSSRAFQSQSHDVVTADVAIFTLICSAHFLPNNILRSIDICGREKFNYWLKKRLDFFLNMKTNEKVDKADVRLGALYVKQL